MSARTADQMRQCLHTCPGSATCTMYRDGQSSSWREHVCLQSSKFHNNCSDTCPGWMKIIEKKLKNSRPPTIATNEALEQDKVFKLLWILDPSGWEKTIKQAKTRSNWTNVSLPSEDLDMLKKDELKGYIFRVKGNEVVMFDNLDLYRLLPTAAYDKQIMPFTTFQTLVLGLVPEELKKFDVVVLPFIAVNLWDKDIYRFENDEDVSMYLKNLESFEADDVHFWPSFAECIAHADKLEQTRRLDEIASKVTFSPRPRTSSTTLQAAQNATKGILKRSFSDQSIHVYDLSDPEKRAGITPDIEKPKAGLLWQQFIPTLISFGELRVAVSYGRVIWRVWTKEYSDGHYEFIDVTHVGKILDVPMSDLSEDAFNNKYVQTSFELERNRRDIDDFAIKTAEALIKKEESLADYIHSLSSFARLDIGIMEGPDGKANFFVNEVERLPAVTLWQGEDHIGPVAAAFHHALYQATKLRFDQGISVRNPTPATRTGKAVP